MMSFDSKIVVITIDAALLSTITFSSSGISFVASAVVCRNRIIMFLIILMLMASVEVNATCTLISDVIKSGS